MITLLLGFVGLGKATFMFNLFDNHKGLPWVSVNTVHYVEGIDVQVVVV